MILEYKIGLPCMMGCVVGRVVGKSDKGSWQVIGGTKMFSILLFCTPHGSVVETGVVHLNEITDAGTKQLLKYEEEIKKDEGELYAGRLPAFPKAQEG